MTAPAVETASSRPTPQTSYLRVSGKGQVDGDGFPRQRDAVERYARSAGLELVGEYRDEGVSGTRDLVAREGLSDLLARIRAGGWFSSNVPIAWLAT